MIKDLIKLANSLDAAGYSKTASAVDGIIEKSSMYLGGGYAICDGENCGARFPMNKGTLTPEGRDLCPVCSGFKSKDIYEAEIAEAQKPYSFGKRYKIYGDEF